MVIVGKNMIFAIPAIAGLGAALLIVATLLLVWAPAKKFARHYADATESNDFLQTMVIAGGGGRSVKFSDGSFEDGLTNEAHDQLNMTESSYVRGLTVTAIVFGLIVAAIIALVVPIWVTAVLVIVLPIAGRQIIHLAIVDKMRENFVDQVRKFPFFLDIFLLTVQAGGDLTEAITMYRRIYGNDAIGRELAILQESYGTHGDAESFDRLRNRVGEVELKNVIGELAQKIRLGDNLQLTLEQQSDDMRQLREELGAKAAERLNAKFAFPVVFSAVATLLIFLAPAIAIIFDAGFL